MDHYRSLPMKDQDDFATLRQFIEKDSICDFLAGLWPEYDQVWVQIFGKTDLPSLNETIAIVPAEESQRDVMLKDQAVEGSTLTIRGYKVNSAAK